MPRRIIALVWVLGLALFAAGCAARGARPAGGELPIADGNPAAPASTNTPRPTSQPVIETPTESGSDPSPTLSNLNDWLLQQAHENATATALAAPTEAAAASTEVPTVVALTEAPTDNGGVATPISGVTTARDVSAQPEAPASPDPFPLYPTSPIGLAGVVLQVQCFISNRGDCSTTMPNDIIVHLDWTLGNSNPTDILYTEVGMVYSRNGVIQGYQWLTDFMAGTGEDDLPLLRGGWEAKFRSGIEITEPGIYHTQLLICQAAIDECAAGSGWFELGGVAVQFVIEE